MKKRKAAGRKTVKKKPALTAKPLSDLWNRLPDGPFGLMPSRETNAVDGVPLPEDFDAVIGFHAGECLLEHLTFLESEPWWYWWMPLAYDGFNYDHGTVEKNCPRYHFYSMKSDLFPGWPPPPPRISEDGNDLSEPEGWNGGNLALTERQLFAVGVAMRDAMREGFYLALLRYADELRHVPEAAALLEAKRRGAKKGGDARRKQAAPNHKAIRRRFKALRKTTPKKTVRYLRVAEEFGMSDRHVARIVDGID